MYYMYLLLNYISIEREAHMSFYRFIGQLFRLKKESCTVFTSFQHKIIWYSYQNLSLWLIF